MCVEGGGERDRVYKACRLMYDCAFCVCKNVYVYARSNYLYFIDTGKCTYMLGLYIYLYVFENIYSMCFFHSTRFFYI